ncbi:MAG: hypothetical protein M1546_03780 [Chloroflexi bacterium]|nr:hypothetical protein [Chloroflexota bacterium]
MKQDFAANWQVQADEVITGVQAWRLAHPQATLKEIEQTIDQQLAALRAHMLADAAMASAVEAAQPVCPACGGAMEWRGTHRRCLVTQHDQAVVLERHYAVCPTCGVGLFPPG